MGMRESGWLDGEPRLYICDECLLGFDLSSGDESIDAFADRHIETCEGAGRYDQGD